jgi:hypothetical protein
MESTSILEPETASIDNPVVAPIDNPVVAPENKMMARPRLAAFLAGACTSSLTVNGRVFAKDRKYPTISIGVVPESQLVLQELFEGLMEEGVRLPLKGNFLSVKCPQEWIAKLGEIPDETGIHSVMVFFRSYYYEGQFGISAVFQSLLK